MTKEEFDSYINEINNSLIPCPFCGGKAKFDCALEVDPVIDENGAYIDADVWYWESIVCTECGAKIELEEEEPEETTVRKWNTRNWSNPVVIGEWIPMDSPDDNGNQRFSCSRCGSSDQHALGVTVPYCWHCGASMINKSEVN